MSIINPFFLSPLSTSTCCGPSTYILPAAGYTQSGPFVLTQGADCNYSGKGAFGQCYTWSPNYQHYAWEGDCFWNGSQWEAYYKEQCWAYLEQSFETGGSDPCDPSVTMFPNI